jgi:cytochrome c556
MKRRLLGNVVVVAGLTAVVAVGCAGSMSKSSIGSGDVVADRQRLMKLNGASWADAQAKFKAGNIEAIAVNAETMALNAEHIPMLFPPGSLTEKSKAKPEIWQRWDEFTKGAKNMEQWAIRLRDTARTKDAAATEAIMKDFGRQACGSCHTPFRVPPPQQQQQPAQPRS